MPLPLSTRLRHGFTLGSVNRHRGLKRSPFRTRPRNTGPDPETQALVMERDGWRCVMCGSDVALTVHHRRNRGKGGSSDPAVNSPANLLTMCVWDNTALESDPKVVAEGYRNGWKVKHGVTPPTEEPVVYRVRVGDEMLRRRFVLDDEGGRVLLSH